MGTNGRTIEEKNAVRPSKSDELNGPTYTNYRPFYDFGWQNELRSNNLCKLSFSTFIASFYFFFSYSLQSITINDKW